MSLAAAAAVAGAALYLNGKHLVVEDAQQFNLLRRMVKGPQYIAEKEAANQLLLYHAIQAQAEADKPGHLFLEFEGRSWTYKQFYDDIQRVGNWLMKDLGIQPGELVAIDGPNTAEYLLLGFALDAIGAAPAHINCNLTGAALEHCVNVANAKHVIADAEVEALLKPSMKTFEAIGAKLTYYDQAMFASFNDKTEIPRSRTANITATDLKCLIYTSGSTGTPKGTVMSTGRLLTTGWGTAQLLKLKSGDKMYTCLPLYHGSAIGLCFAASIMAGTAVVLGRKFSHKTFWPEVSASGATHLQYVGELCRYLVNAPPHPLERQHKVTVAWGNGMRPDIWERFRQRFNIPIIWELFAGTDAVSATFNANKGPFSRGAIAVRGSIMRRLMGKIQIRAKIDPDTEEIIRGPDGFIIKCNAGEPGEMLSKVEHELKETSFRGYYNNKSSTEKRWMTDVLEKGDLYFRSGDVLREDADGRLYFVDRLGDTFRWKSENVSTSEVADTLGLFPQVAECSVYGVAVPKADGRCGCATIVLNSGLQPENVDLSALAKHATSRLPKYAVPLFLRITPELVYTGTFKIQKGQAKREGIDLDLIEGSGSKDKVFWLPPGAKAYQPYTRADYKALQDGAIRL